MTAALNFFKRDKKLTLGGLYIKKHIMLYSRVQVQWFYRDLLINELTIKGGGVHHSLPTNPLTSHHSLFFSSLTHIFGGAISLTLHSPTTFKKSAQHSKVCSFPRVSSSLNGNKPCGKGIPAAVLPCVSLTAPHLHSPTPSSLRGPFCL